MQFANMHHRLVYDIAGQGNETDATCSCKWKETATSRQSPGQEWANDASTTYEHRAIGFLKVYLLHH